MECFVGLWIFSVIFALVGFAYFMSVGIKELGEGYLWKRGDVLVILAGVALSFLPLVNFVVIFVSVRTFIDDMRYGGFTKWMNTPLKRKVKDAK